MKVDSIVIDILIKNLGIIRIGSDRHSALPLSSGKDKQIIQKRKKERSPIRSDFKTLTAFWEFWISFLFSQAFNFMLYKGKKEEQTHMCSGSV